MLLTLFVNWCRNEIFFGKICWISTFPSLTTNLLKQTLCRRKDFALFHQKVLETTKETRVVFLRDTFNKFDSSEDGCHGMWEFKQAWLHLGLKGSESEISNAFKSVDTDDSGLVDLEEFMTAIRNEVILSVICTLW